MENKPLYCEVQPPEIRQILSLEEPEKSFAEYWPNLICIIDSVVNPQIFYLMMRGRKGFIYGLEIEKGNIMSKKAFKISYSVHNTITCLTTSDVPPMSASITKQNKSKTIKYLFIGYEQSSIELHTVSGTQQGNLILTKKLLIHPNSTKPHPTLNIKYWNNCLIVCHSNQLSMIKNIFDTQKGNQTINPKATQFQISQDLLKKQKKKLNFTLCEEQGQLYVYNQIDGVSCFDLDAFETSFEIQDMIRFMAIVPKFNYKGKKEKQEGNYTIVIGATDDTIKFIDYHFNVVEKFYGFKSYPSCYCLEVSQNQYRPNVLWVGNYDGTISSFVYLKKSAENKVPNKAFKLIETKVKYQRKICQAGICNIIIKDNLMIVKDTEYNIKIFDIIRDLQETDRTQTVSEQNL